MLTKQELRQLQEKELMEELSGASRELFKAMMEHSSGTLKETHRLVELKRHIARMKTIMAESKHESAVKTTIAPAVAKPAAAAVPPAPPKAKRKKIK
jgi:ribosomal protein L29